MLRGYDAHTLGLWHSASAQRASGPGRGRSSGRRPRRSRRSRGYPAARGRSAARGCSARPRNRSAKIVEVRERILHALSPSVQQIIKRGTKCLDLLEVEVFVQNRLGEVQVRHGGACSARCVGRQATHRVHELRHVQIQLGERGVAQQTGLHHVPLLTNERRSRTANGLQLLFDLREQRLRLVFFRAQNSVTLDDIFASLTRRGRHRHSDGCLRVPLALRVDVCEQTLVESVPCVGARLTLAEGGNVQAHHAADATQPRRLLRGKYGTISPLGHLRLCGAADGRHTDARGNAARKRVVLPRFSVENLRRACARVHSVLITIGAAHRGHTSTSHSRTSGAPGRWQRAQRGRVTRPRLSRLGAENALPRHIDDHLALFGNEVLSPRGHALRRHH